MRPLPPPRPLLLVSASLALLALGACAHTETAPGSGAFELPPSSLSLLLEARESLALTPEQVQQVAERDAQLELQTHPVLEELRTLQEEAQRTRAAAAAGRGDDGFAGGRGPGGRGGGTGGARAESEELRGRRAYMRSLVEQLQSLDAQAYRDVEGLLREEQKDPARAIVVERNRRLLQLRPQQREGGHAGPRHGRM